jgi:DNA-binding MarR family transcriptional regulator
MSGNKSAKVTLDDFKIFDALAEQGREVAGDIYQKTPIPHAITTRAYDVNEFLESLTPKRLQLLRLARTGKRSISELANEAGRDPSAVSKDIGKLVELGLISIVIQRHPGQRERKIVRPSAQQIEISTEIF